MNITNWDDIKKEPKKGTDDVLVQSYVEDYAGDCFLNNARTDLWYFWKYLGADGTGINFRECNESFERLLDEDIFESEVQEICKEIEKCLRNWGML